MSDENVEIARRAMEAFNRRDRAAFLAVCDPEAEHHPSREWPETAPIRGDEAIWDFFIEVVQAWDNAEFEWGDLTDAGGDEVIASLLAQPRGKSNGADVLWSLGVILTFRDRRVLRWQWFADRAEALEAAGLSA